MRVRKSASPVSDFPRLDTKPRPSNALLSNPHAMFSGNPAVNSKIGQSRQFAAPARTRQKRFKPPTPPRDRLDVQALNRATAASGRTRARRISSRREIVARKAKVNLSHKIPGKKGNSPLANLPKVNTHRELAKAAGDALPATVSETVAPICRQTLSASGRFFKPR